MFRSDHSEPKTTRAFGVGFCLLLLAGACGGDDDLDQLCDDLKAKVDECNLQVDTSGGCNEGASDAVVCAARCAANATCEELTGPATDNEYYRCSAECSGAGPDDFICADGAGFLPPEGVCNGAADCPDGSDEAGCPS